MKKILIQKLSDTKKEYENMKIQLTNEFNDKNKKLTNEFNDKNKKLTNEFNASKKALQDKNEQLKKEYDEKQKDIDRQNQIIRDSKFECVSEENIFSIPRSKRFLYLNDEAKVFNCELQGYSARDKALYNIPQNIKKMNLDFVKNLTQSCKTGVGFDQQCKTEEDCRYWGFGKDGKGNTCNLYTKKCIKLAKGGNKQNGIYDCNNDGWFSKLSYGKYVDAEKVCRLNGFVAGISSNYYGKFDKYEEMCKPQNNQKGITETNKIKTVDKDMLVSWKCVGERQKPAVFIRFAESSYNQ